MRDLEAIMRYKMDPVESKAYKIALAWQEECGREIPGEPYARIKTNSDPRKSLLFKYCFKLAKEISGIIPDKEIPLYVRAQIQTLKAISDGKVHALIEPHCLVGDKAWRRWKLWKSRHDRKMAAPIGSSEAMVRPSEGKVRREMLSDLDFLTKMNCTSSGSLSERKDEVLRWIKSGELSCFWAVLSPRFRSEVGSPSEMDFDHNYYRNSITPSLEEFFRQLFDHEFEASKC